MNSMSMETLQCIDLRRLRWRGVWLPTAGIAAIILAEGILENYSNPICHESMLTIHGLMIAAIALGIYLSSNWMFGIIRQDREEIVRRSQAIAALDRRFRALIENGSDLIALLGPDRTVRYTSPSVGRDLGYAAEELSGRDALDFVRPEDRSIIEAKLRDLSLKSGTTDTATVRVQS